MVLWTVKFMFKINVYNILRIEVLLIYVIRFSDALTGAAKTLDMHGCLVQEKRCPFNIIIIMFSSKLLMKLCTTESICCLSDSVLQFPELSYNSLLLQVTSKY